MQLSTAYMSFTIFETVMINFVGFLSLLFQPWLQRQSKQFAESRKMQEDTTWRLDPLFALFWTNANASDKFIYLFHLIVAGWLAVAGALQGLINFSTTSFELKRGCLYVFFLCDVFWIGLMVAYRKEFKWTHIWGSIFTIAWRLPFVLVPSLMYQ